MSSIKPAKLADAVADHIQSLILEGALQPGEQLLSERELSVKLDVSRPSLRAALERLVEDGLLKTDANGACFVSDNVGCTLRDPLVLLMETPEARLDCMEFRAEIEAAAAGYAAQRASDVDLQAIQEQFERMERAHQAGDACEITAADADFHLAIYMASHNVMMLHVMRSIESILRSNIYLNRKNLFEYRRIPDSQLAEHRAIYEAIRDRDPQAARRAARLHMASGMQAQREIHETERRKEASIRRLAGSEFVARRRRRSAPRG